MHVVASGGRRISELCVSTEDRFISCDVLTARMVGINSTIEASFAQGLKGERKRSSIVQPLLARFDGGEVPKRVRTALTTAQDDQAERMGHVGHVESMYDTNGAAIQTTDFTQPQAVRNHYQYVKTRKQP